MRKAKKEKKAGGGTAPPTNGPIPEPPEEVMTLRETAAFLRASEEAVLHSIVGQGLPGRLVGDEWKFLKSALIDWLRTPPPAPSQETFLSTFGTLKDDPHLEEMLREIYKRRGRPMTEGGE
jgi:hypothetical protein